MSNVYPISTTVSSPVTPYELTASAPELTGGDGSTSGTENIDAVSKDFEAVFLSQMMGAMFSGDDINSFFGGGTTGDVYKGMMLNEYGKAMANAGGIGIAEQVKQELLKMQEIAA